MISLSHPVKRCRTLRQVIDLDTCVKAMVPRDGIAISAIQLKQRTFFERVLFSVPANVPSFNGHAAEALRSRLTRRQAAFTRRRS